MALEAVRSAGAAFQTVSAPEVTKEVSQPKVQVAEVQSGSAALAEKTVKMDVKESKDQQGSNQEAKNQVNAEKVKKAVEQINKKTVSSEAIFGIHEGTNRVMIKIVDKDTKEVLKEFPPEKTLDMIVKAWELAGILVDEKR